MIGSKSQSRVKAAGLGITLQSSTYGETIRVFYGRTKGSLSLIWANNLRQGDSGKGAKKILSFGKKNNPPSYLENVDFLLGHNPIAGVLQFWANQDQRYPLLFTAYATTAAAGTTSYTVPDPDFYQILGVTLTIPFSASFSDYGAPAGKSSAGDFEVPLWNLAFAGPDPTRGYADRYFPYYFYWLPGSGPTITLPQNAFTTAITGTLTIYYAQLDPNGSPSYSKKNAGTDVPAGALHLTFEPVLGDGPEFTGNDQNGNPLSAQQILYPHYAGLGSDRLDLGMSTGIPLIVPEVLGTYPLYKTGDADYADMVEDIFTKGQTQAGFGAQEAYTLVHHGLGAYEFPGAVQLITLNDSAGTVGPIPYSQPNKLNNFLIVFTNPNGGTPSISDTAGNVWTSVVLSSGSLGQVWTAKAIGGSTSSPSALGGAVLNQVTVSGLSAFWQTSVMELGGVDVLDAGITTVGSNSASITTSNAKGTPCYLIAFVSYAAAGATNVMPSISQWKNLVSGKVTKDFFCQYRIVYSPATYTYTVPDTVADGHPTQIVLLAFKCSEPPGYPRPLGNILDKDSLELTRTQCRANGLWGSLMMDSQQTAADWLGDGIEKPGIFEAMNAAPVWSGFSLKVIPRSEVSMAGNGAIYNAPTASGPVAVLTIPHFVASETEPLIVWERTAQVDVPNILQVQFPNREGDYNDVTIMEPETGSIALYSPRKDSPRQMRMIQETSIARMILGILVRKQNYIRNTAKFTLNAKWKLLEAMDLVRLPADPQTGAPAIDVRLTSIEEDEKYNLMCEAEPFLYGVYAPSAVPVTAVAPNPTQLGGSPGRVNAPVFLEPVAGLNPAPQIWIAVSAPSTNYAGSQVWLSTDGGASYTNVGATTGNAITGHTVGDWPTAADPDTVNDLNLDLTESNGVLASYPVSDEDNFVHPSYVQGGTTVVPYELMTYSVATLTGPSAYRLMASGGNHLRRAVDNAPLLGMGVDHPDGSRYAFLGPQAPGIFKIGLNSIWIGQTLWFKFLAFNQFMGSVESLDDAVPYPYTPVGSGGIQPTPQVFVDGVPVSYDLFFAVDGIAQGTMIPTGI